MDFALRLSSCFARFKSGDAIANSLPSSQCKREQRDYIAPKLSEDFTAVNPGLTLFHCHQQLHMDFGFMTLFDYA